MADEDGVKEPLDSVRVELNEGVRECDGEIEAEFDGVSDLDVERVHVRDRYLVLLDV